RSPTRCATSRAGSVPSTGVSRGSWPSGPRDTPGDPEARQGRRRELPRDTPRSGAPGVRVCSGLGRGVGDTGPVPDFDLAAIGEGLPFAEALDDLRAAVGGRGVAVV